MAATVSRGRWWLTPHLALLDEALCDLAVGALRGLLVQMPPRHGKSELCSHWFPVWFLSQWPRKHVILAGYGSTFAATWGRAARDSIAEAAELGVSAVKVRDDSAAVDVWELVDYGGGMIATGIGGSITGRGADALIIDDPVKNAEEAHSPTYRNACWQWYVSTARTRLEPEGFIIVVMTRWHLDDLGGRILAELPAGWRVITLPAIAEAGDPLGREAGEALWPERYPLDALETAKTEVGSYVWSALYQQKPYEHEGKLFRREWFADIIDAAPKGGQAVRFWDLAATAEKPGTDPDWTVGLLLIRSDDGTYTVADVQRVRATPQGVQALVKQTAELDGRSVPVAMEQEPGAAGKSLAAHYRQVLDGWAFHAVPSTGDKVVRAQPSSAQAEAGNIRLVRGPWISAFLDELTMFPGGAHDDQVDALSGAHGWLSGKRMPQLFT